MSFEQYKQSHNNPIKDHWVIFKTNSGNEFLLTVCDVFGEDGEERNELIKISDLAFDKYQGPWNGSPMAYLVSELENSKLGEITERHYDFNDPDFSSYK